MRTARGPAIVLLGLALQWCLAPAWAHDVRIVSQQGAGSIVIEAQGATASEILAVLAREFRFGIEGTADGDQPVRFTGRLQGSIDRLLERLLRHTGYVVVRSSEKPGGIARIVMLDGKEGRRPAASPPRTGQADQADHAGRDIGEAQAANASAVQPTARSQAAEPAPASNEASDQRRANARPLFSRWYSR